MLEPFFAKYNNVLNLCACVASYIFNTLFQQGWSQEEPDWS